MIKFENFEIVTKTDKAVLLSLEGKKYWFQLSKITLLENEVEIPKDIYEEALKKEVKVECIKLHTSCEDYSEKTYKILLPIKKDTYEAEKFFFIPKKAVLEIKEDYVIIPKWLWDKGLEELLDKEVAYFNDKFNEQCTTNDYEVLLETEEVEL